MVWRCAVGSACLSAREWQHCVDKQKFLKSLDDQNPFTSRKTEDFGATIVGERALVTLVIHTMKADGTENRYRNIRLFSQQNQSWKLELWYNYDLTGL